MAEQANNSKPLKWAYPFQAKDDSATKDRKIVEDSKSYFEALALANDGFYPVGSNGLWHGGIHFSKETGAKLDQEKGVRAIADGEVVAYRIDSAYPNVNYDCGSATYSTGFVLVKHELKLPKAPEKKTDTASQNPTKESSDSNVASPATTTPVDEPGLVFYSLYMHLLDWSHYQENRKLSRPKFWDNEFVVTDKSKDREEQLAPGQVGIRVRDANHEPIAILPRGTQVKLGAEGKHKGYFSIASVTSGAAIPAISDGYVYKKELGAAGSPSSKDAVVFLSKPVPVAAGELVGHLGQYARFADAGPLAGSDRALMHLEVFSTDDVKGFVEKSRARDKQLNADAKTLLVVPKGARLVLSLEHDTSIAAGEDVLVASDSPKQGEWAKVHKTGAAQTSSALWVERKMLSFGGNRTSTNDSLVAWTRFPLQASNATGPSSTFERVASIQSLTPMATDDQGIRWWQIDVDTPDANGNVLGWICETGNLQSPWAWPGFEFIEEQIPATDLHGKQIIDQRLDTPADSADFKAKAEKANAGPLFQKLYDIIDTDKKSGLTTEELRAALRKPWLAQAISHLIVRYESEWGGEMSKWDELDSHMGDSINDWQKEKERIKRLQWWKDVPGLGSPEAYHFHPVGMINKFSFARKRMRHDYNLGNLSSKYETGGRGSITVSTGTGDAGGVSYGAYQMTSKPNGGRVREFINSNGFPWKEEFDKLVPGTEEFTKKWKEIVTLNKDKFREVEHAFIERTHYRVQIEKVLRETGVDLRYHSHTTNNVIWSTAVQQGPSNGIIIKSIKAMNIPHDETKEYDRELIKLIYSERGRKNKNGDLFYFSKNSRKIQAGVSDRFLNEQAQALGDLENEKNY